MLDSHLIFFLNCAWLPHKKNRTQLPACQNRKCIMGNTPYGGRLLHNNGLFRLLPPAQHICGYLLSSHVPTLKCRTNWVWPHTASDIPAPMCCRRMGCSASHPRSYLSQLLFLQPATALLNNGIYIQIQSSNSTFEGKQCCLTHGLPTTHCSKILVGDV